MANFDPVSKAKQVAEQAAQVALGVKEGATSRAADFGEQTAAKVGGLKDLVAGKIGDIKDAAISEVQRIVADLNQHLPALREAGYALTDVTVDLGLPPNVVASFSAQPDITEERVDAVIKEHEDARLTVTLLRTLFRAYKLQNSIAIAGMKPHGIALTIGITPGIAVKFG